MTFFMHGDLPVQVQVQSNALAHFRVSSIWSVWVEYLHLTELKIQLRSRSRFQRLSSQFSSLDYRIRQSTSLG
jgi:hypothetical protein